MHDLRTPIASLSTHLETLREHPEHLEEYLPVLSGETTRVACLLDDLFELSRLDIRVLSLELGAVDLSKVIGKIAERYKALAWESPSRARLEGDDHLSSGSGLGLTIVKGLADEMGGEAAAESVLG